jgi:hypothetical protein
MMLSILTMIPFQIEEVVVLRFKGEERMLHEPLYTGELRETTER